MSKSIRWSTITTLGAATWVMTSSLAGCAQKSADETAGEDATAGATQNLAGAEGEGEGEGRAAASGQSEGEGEGEGEGARTNAEGEGEGEGSGSAAEGEGEGEGEGASGANFATDDVAYLTQLGLIRGHLAVGHELYRQGRADLARTHMKHPRAEIYSVVEPAFAARGCSGFADGLSALTAKVDGEAPQAEVSAAYDELVASIASCEKGAAVNDPAVAADVIEALLRVAGVEYRIGIVDGTVNNLHEYQDAWGFTQVAMDWAQAAAFAGDASAAAVAAQLQTILRDLSDLWPSLAPEGGVDGDAARLFGAAGEVELAALGLIR